MRPGSVCHEWFPQAHEWAHSSPARGAVCVYFQWRYVFSGGGSRSLRADSEGYRPALLPVCYHHVTCLRVSHFVGDRTVLLQCHVNVGLHCDADWVRCYGDERKASLNSPLYVAVRLKLL